MSNLVRIMESDIDSIFYEESIVTKEPYLELKNHLISMERLSTNIEKKVKEEKNFLYRYYYKIKRCFVKSDNRSIDDLFSVQLENINYLNLCLENINFKAREELRNIEDYSNSILSSFKENLLSVDERKACLEREFSYAKDLKDKTKDVRRGSEGFFDIEEELRKLKRSIKEKRHEYVLNNDNIVDLFKEIYVVNVIEDFLRCSIHISERMAEKTIRISRHLSVTKKSYSTLYQQQKSILHLSRALDVVKNYTLQVQSILGEGLKELDLILDKSFDNFYDQNFIELNTSLRTPKVILKDMENERKIKDFLKG